MLNRLRFFCWIGLLCALGFAGFAFFTPGWAAYVLPSLGFAASLLFLYLLITPGTWPGALLGLLLSR